MKKFMLAVVFMVLSLANIVSGKTVTRKCGEHTLKISQTKAGTKVRWDGNVYAWYDFDGAIKIVPENKLTPKMLRKRRNKVLYVEKIVGTVINKSMDGITSNGNYISYRNLKGYARKGDKVITYCIFSPYTRWIDDREHRFDAIVQR